ncbi:MAG: tetratricopeptide repeat protein [Myxococcales bacterium]|nr:tetratricopeptide repeat protein [Myxococcales bacterium]
MSPLPSEEGEERADVVGRFFDEADLIEASPVVSSRGTSEPTRFDLPWQKGGAGADPTLGRKAEAEDLSNRIGSALGAKKAGAILVRGEVGSGRSQLFSLARAKVAGAHPETRFLATSAQGAHRPHSLLERLVRLRFDIPEYLGGTIAGERFERAVESLFGDSTGADVARTCGPMLGFHFWNEHAIDFEDRREQSRRAHEALSALWQRDLRGTATVLMIDDAGEADAESLEFLSQVLKDLPGQPIYWVFAANQRGTLRRQWLSELETLPLEPLEDSLLRKIATESLHGVQGVDDRVLDALVAVADGKPGALLGAIESLMTGGGIVEMGDSWHLKRVILSEMVERGKLRSRKGGRFDMLSEDELLVARMGAIFGLRFWLGGVSALLRTTAEDQARTLKEFGQDGVPERVARACSTLVDAGLVVRERTSTLPTETCYRFVDEGDLDKLLELIEEKERTALMYRAAVWLELVAPHRGGELADVLAPLWLAAGEETHAAHLYLHAGQRAREELHHDAAQRYFEKARKLAPDAAQDIQLFSLMALGDLAELDGRWEEAEARFRDVLGLAWSYRARGQGAEALQRIGRLYRSKGKLNIALEHLIEAMNLYKAVGDISGLAGACDDIGRAYWLSGNLKPALNFLQRAAQYREKAGDRTGLATTLTNLGILSMSGGNLDRARTYLERAVSLRRDGRHSHGLLESLNAMGALQLTAGETDAAVAAMEEAYELSKRVGNRRMQGMLQNNLGETLINSGRLTDGEGLLYKAVESAGRLADHNLLSDAARNLAIAARLRNDGDRALKWSRRAVAAGQLSDVTRVRAAAMGTLAEILADREETDAADTAFTRAAQLWKEANERAGLSACLQAHAAFLVRIGEQKKAADLLVRVDQLQRRGRRANSSVHGDIAITPETPST